MGAAKKVISKLSSALGAGGDMSAAGAAGQVAAKPMASPEADEAARAARRRPLAKLTSKSGRLSNILGQATTLG